MVSAIFNAISSAITSFGAVVGSGISSAVALFWDGTALTDAGTLLLIASGVGLVWMAVFFITKLVRVKTN